MTKPIVASGNGSQTISADLIEIVDATTNKVVSGTTQPAMAGGRLELKARLRLPAKDVDSLEWSIHSPSSGGRKFSQDGTVYNDAARLTTEDLKFYFTGKRGKIPTKVRASYTTTETGPDGMVKPGRVKRTAEAMVQFDVDAPILAHFEAGVEPMRLDDKRLRALVNLDVDHASPQGTKWEACVVHVMNNAYFQNEQQVNVRNVPATRSKTISNMKSIDIEVLDVSEIPFDTGSTLEVRSTHVFHYCVRQGPKVVSTDNDTMPTTIGLVLGKLTCTWVGHLRLFADGWLLAESKPHNREKVVGSASNDLPQLGSSHGAIRHW